MRILSMAETVNVSGGNKPNATPVGPKSKPLPAKAVHGVETATAASNKPKKPKKGK
jgi:hypothetical protein